MICYDFWRGTFCHFTKKKFPIIFILQSFLSILLFSLFYQFCNINFFQKFTFCRYWKWSVLIFLVNPEVWGTFFSFSERKKKTNKYKLPNKFKLQCILQTDYIQFYRYKIYPSLSFSHSLSVSLNHSLSPSLCLFVSFSLSLSIESLRIHFKKSKLLNLELLSYISLFFSTYIIYSTLQVLNFDSDNAFDVDMLIIAGEPYQELLNPGDKKLFPCQKCPFRFARELVAPLSMLGL